MKRAKELSILILFSVLNCIPPAPILTTSLAILTWKRTYTSRDSIIPVIWFLALSMPFLIPHIANGIDTTSYMISYALAVYIIFTSCATARYCITNVTLEPAAIKISFIVFFVYLCSTLLLVLKGPTWIPNGWYEHSISAGVSAYRYGGFQYEASYFCLVACIPLLYLIYLPKKRLLHLVSILMLAAPIVSTLSLGFTATFIAAISITGLIKYKHIISRPATAIKLAIAAPALIIAMISIEPIRERIDNLLNREDSSINGRTTDAFELATTIANTKSAYAGIGIGQIKIAGHDIIMEFYGYPEDFGTVRIPSSAAEVLASFGIVGLTVKILLLTYLFLRHRIYSTGFSCSLFIFTFLYQFYGSFLLSGTEVFSFALACIYAKSSAKVVRQ